MAAQQQAGEVDSPATRKNNSMHQYSTVLKDYIPRPAGNDLPTVAQDIIGRLGHKDWNIIGLWPICQQS